MKFSVVLKSLCVLSVVAFVSFAGEARARTGDGSSPLALAAPTNFVEEGGGAGTGGGGGTPPPDFQVQHYSTQIQDPYAFAAGDFNADGNTDIVVVSSWDPWPGSITILINDGAGHFLQKWGPFEIGTNFNAAGPDAVEAMDLNNDGYSDVVTANSLSDNISVFINNQQNGFASPVHYAAGRVPQSLAAGDLNNDGTTDVVVGRNGFPETLSIFFNIGNGSFGVPQIIPLPSMYSSNMKIAAMDNNTSPDIAISSDRHGVMKNNGYGGFCSSVSYQMPDFPNYTKFDVADLDGDGDKEFAIVIGSDGPSVQNRISLWVNNGSASFTEATNIPLDFFGSSVVALDANHDSRPDIAISDYQLNRVSIFQNNSALNFTLRYVIPVQSGPRQLLAFDANHDGKVDLISLNGNSGTFSVITFP